MDGIADANGRVLVVIYTYRGEKIRIISARAATPPEREQYSEGI
ncbi:MAG: BrnT family toxin [Acidobacteriota bacterium]